MKKSIANPVTGSFLLALLFSCSLNSTGQINTSEVNKIVDDEMIRQNLPGLVLGIYNNGASYIQGYGYSNLNRTQRITTGTIFRWASISKTLTAVVALQLIEGRKDLSIEDKVANNYSHWIANVTEGTVSDKTRKSNITVKNLLNNRSGINQYGRGTKDVANEYTNKDRSAYSTDTDKFNANSATDIFRKANLDFDPGSKFLYSSFGFTLLGAYVDKLSGSYTSLVKMNVIDKIRSSTQTFRVSTGNFTGFQRSVDGIINTKTIDSREWVLPGGGWESNINDLLKFARGIVTKQFLGSKTSLLWADDGNKDSKGNPQEYKRGIYSSVDPTSSKFRVWHGGNHDNMTTLLYVLPNRNIAIVMMIPMQSADRWNITKRIVNLLIPNFYSAASIDEYPLDTCNDDMGSSNRKYICVWRKRTSANVAKDVIIRRGYSSDNFNKEWNFLSSKGYHLESFDYTNNQWNGIFKKGTGQYAMWRNFNQAGFNAKWQEMNTAGYRLYDLETYVIGGKRYWAGLFKKSTGKYALYRNYSTSAFGAKWTELRNQGYKLIDVEVYSDASGLKWSGVWVEGTGELLNRNYTESDFKNLVNSRRSSGYQLIDVETYIDGGVRKWAGIWEKSTEAGYMNSPQNYCLTMKSHNSVVNSYSGYELIKLISY